MKKNFKILSESDTQLLIDYFEFMNSKNDNILLGAESNINHSKAAIRHSLYSHDSEYIAYIDENSIKALVELSFYADKTSTYYIDSVSYINLEYLKNIFEFIRSKEFQPSFIKQISKIRFLYSNKESNEMDWNKKLYEFGFQLEAVKNKENKTSLIMWLNK